MRLTGQAYGGVNAGDGWNKTDFTDYNSGGGVFNKGSADSSGFFGGGQFGYNFQCGNFVLARKSISAVLKVVSASNNGLGLRPEYKIHGGFYGDITGRMGYTVDKALVYAKGGSHSWTGKTRFPIRLLATLTAQLSLARPWVLA